MNITSITTSNVQSVGRWRYCNQSELTCPWRHIDNQIVQDAPGYLPDHLIQRALDHRAPPHGGRVVRDKESDRHAFDPVVHQRRQHFVLCHGGLPREVEHARYAQTVDVSIEDADSVTLRGQRQREVDSDC